ncbi:unnamed protein product [Phytomonas sp. Hart1]|nr:unnamed protein product [Phytomonas sp. Hart1]|eukprot:CCW71385.1 unnamed protein product [Phytomonas sp. isolate Hart1]
MEDRAVVLSVREDLLHGPFLRVHTGPEALPPLPCVEASAGEGESLARANAVLLLPLFGPNFTAVLPYLVRCADEEDPQLSFAVAIALMGMLRPRPCAKARLPTWAESARGLLGGLGAVRGVLTRLSASREGRIRHLVSDVVLPHLGFGVGLERKVTLEGWERRYIPPQSGHPDDKAGEGDFYWSEAETTAMAPGEGAKGSDGEAVKKDEEETDETNPLLLEERLKFIHDDEFISLFHSARVHHEARCQGGDGELSRSRTTAAHQQQSACTAPSRSSFLLDVPLELYGASYAAALHADSENDPFSLNLRARSLVGEIESWLTGFTSAEKQRGSSQKVSPFLNKLRAKNNSYNLNTDNQVIDSSPVKPLQPLQYQLSVADYLECDSVQRKTLGQQWEHFQRLIQYLLNSTYPGAVAVAVATISRLLHVIQSALAEGPNCNTLLNPGSLVSISLPQKLLRTAAELRHFITQMTHRHIFMVLTAATSSRRAPHTASETVSLVQEALIEVRGTLRSILKKHHLLIDTPSIASLSGINGASFKGLLCFGPGPRELRIASLSAWDAGLGLNSPDSIPRLLIEPPGAVDDGNGDCHHNSQFRQGGSDIGGFSPRLHRILHLSLIRALPSLLDWGTVFGTPFNTTATTGRNRSHSSMLSPVTIRSFITIFMQLLVPASEIPELLHMFAEMTNTTKWTEKIHLATQSETDLTGAEPNSNGKLSSLHHLMGETLASLDFDMVQTALKAAHECFVEAAIALPMLLYKEFRKGTSTSPYTRSDTVEDSRIDTQLRDLLSCLYMVYYMCAKYIAFYPSWKARYQVAKKLPGLTAAFVYVLLRLKHALATIADTTTENGISYPVASTLHFYCKLCKLLTDLWSSKGGVAHPLGCWVNDYETEVRAMVLPCAADTFFVMVQGVVGLCHSEMKVWDVKPNRQVEAVATWSRENVHLFEMLLILLESILHVSQFSLQDTNEQVRSGSPTALTSLSSSLWVLIESMMYPNPNNTSLSNRTLVNKTMHARNGIRSLIAADALVRLIDDPSPLVRLAAASGLADSIASFTKRRGRIGEIEEGDSTTFKAQCRGLFFCMESLSKHESWRFREKYSALLSAICFKFLAPTYPQNLEVCNRVITSSRESHEQQGDLESVAEDSDRYSLPLLIYTKLLPMLVELIFDKGKAVRDAALSHVSYLCTKLASVHTSHEYSRTRPASFGGATARPKNILRTTLHTKESAPLMKKDKFVSNVLWPLITSHPAAWSTYLNRSALLYAAVHLGVDVETTLLPLLNMLARDLVPNVRSMVAKMILEVLLNSSRRPMLNRTKESCPCQSSLKARQDNIQNDGVGSVPTCSSRNANKIKHIASCNATRLSDEVASLAPLIFTDEEKNGVVLVILRQLLEDTSADVRNQAAEAFRVCF